MPVLNWKKALVSYGIVTAGSLIYAFAFDYFYAPNGIAYGGVTGLSQMFNHLFGTPPVGVLIILMNIPLFLVGWRRLGGRTLLSSLYAMTVSSVAIDALAAWYTFPPMEDPLMAALCGGTVMGISMGLIFREGATTGGVDILARLIKLRLTWVPLGRMLMVIDLVVITGVALEFRQLNSALYGFVGLVVSSKFIDVVIYGGRAARLAYIISDRHQEIAQVISDQLGRGVTFLQGKGAWSGLEKQVLLCAIKTRQIVTLKRLVKAADPNAFLIVCEAREVLGTGFISLDHPEI